MEAGIYENVKVKSVGIGVSKEKNTPYVAVNLDINGETIQWQGWLSDKAIENTKISLDIMGWNGDWHSLAKGEGFDLRKEFQVTVVEEYYQDKTYKKVRWINPSGTAGSKGLLDETEALKVLGGLGLTDSNKDELPF